MKQPKQTNSTIFLPPLIPNQFTRESLPIGQFEFFPARMKPNALPRNGTPTLLLSAARQGKNDRAITYSRELINYFGVKTLMLDSGGFTILGAEKKEIPITFDPDSPLIVTKKRLNIAPRHVVEAATKLNPQIMVALDYPIRKFKDRKEQVSEFNRKLPYNVKWAIETAKLKEKYCPDIELFIPVQCYSLEDFKQFYRRIQRINFDGFSMPIRNLKLNEIASFLLEFHKMGIKKVHLLGTASLRVMAIAAYFTNHYLDWVSFDSSGWIIAAEHSKYLNPLNLSYINLNNRLSPKQTRFQQCCGCPVCTTHSLSRIKQYPYQKRCFLLGTHNVYAIRKFASDLHAAVQDRVQLEGFLRSRGVNQWVIKQIETCLTMVEFSHNSDRFGRVSEDRRIAA